MELTYLKIERYKRGLTQEELAKVLGISRGYISLIEAQKEKPGKFLALEMERYFNEPIERLLQKVEL